MGAIKTAFMLALEYQIVLAILGTQEQHRAPQSTIVQVQMEGATKTVYMMGLVHTTVHVILATHRFQLHALRLITAPVRMEIAAKFAIMVVRGYRHADAMPVIC